MNEVLNKEVFLVTVDFEKAFDSVKVARLVNLKLVFTDKFFYNLVILIKLYKIWYLN